MVLWFYGHESYPDITTSRRLTSLSLWQRKLTCTGLPMTSSHYGECTTRLVNGSYESADIIATQQRGGGEGEGEREGGAGAFKPPGGISAVDYCIPQYPLCPW